MISVVHTATLLGMNAVPVVVEVDVNRKAFPRVRIVGEASPSITESQDRVRTAIKNSGFRFPDGKITINLSPANLRKHGAHFDLPIALGILIASGQLPRTAIENTVLFGELSLSGEVRAVPGMVSLGESASLEQHVIMPYRNRFEGSILSRKRICTGITHLQDIRDVDHLKKFTYKPVVKNSAHGDFSSITGMEYAKRACEIAAAGFHHVHMSGPPGAGKTALASLIPSILPPLTEEEYDERARIESLTGKPGENTVLSPPFRTPHHTVSFAGLIGGGTHLIPGEITLAHRGILFLDEFPEFRQQHIEALRQPLEEGTISLSRLHLKVQYPSRFLLVAASNPCPCGNFGLKEKDCTCTSYQLEQYRKKISGPIQDRIDLHVQLPLQKIPTSQNTSTGETSTVIRNRVIRARQRQQKRYRAVSVSYTGLLNGEQVEEFCKREESAQKLLITASEKLGLSMRGYYKAIKVAQTIADLEEKDIITIDHVRESLQYRYFST